MNNSKLDCIHQSTDILLPVKQVCSHLYNKKVSEFYRSFTGVGKEYQLICGVCETYLNKFSLDLKNVCDDCFNEIENQYDFYEYLGQPGITESSTELCLSHLNIPLPIIDVDTVQAIVPLAVDPVSGESGSKWLMVDTANHVKLFDLEHNYVSLLAIVPSESLNPKGKISIRVALNGDFAAIVSAGRTTIDHKAWNHGVVVGLTKGEITMELNRGDYHTEQSDFSCVFFESQNKTFMVHATDWNRLDISDPATGELLTQRDPETRPAEAWLFNKNNTTEFSGRLIVSPDQRWIVDSGWVWHPVGVVSRWDLQHWLHKNVWESDNGPSKLSLVHRAYFWDGPICWIDSNTLCVWGLGEDEDNMVPAALIIDIQTGELKDWFPGPGTGLFVFDEYLYTVDDGAFSAWDIVSGQRVLFEADFAPVAYDSVTKKFLSIVNSEFVISAIDFENSIIIDLSSLPENYSEQVELQG